MKDQRTARYESFAETVQTGNLLFLTGMPPLGAPVELEVILEVSH